MNENFLDLIKEICDENNIKCTNINQSWFMILEKNNTRKFINGYKFDKNNHALGKILDDKFATYELLKSLMIPVCEHNILYSENNQNEYAEGFNNINYLNSLFNKYNNDIVIKINEGTCGINVNRINDNKTLKEFYKSLNDKTKSYSVCPFYNIKNEYRLIIVNNEVKVIYKKELPLVYGDGLSTIKELLKKFNYEYFKNINDKNLDKVLGINEKYMYNWKFNLSCGSRASFEINEKDKIRILEIVNNLLNKIELGFCSVDIIKTIDNEYIILEINSGVMMKNLIKENENGLSIAKSIYKEAILSMFK